MAKKSTKTAETTGGVAPSFTELLASAVASLTSGTAMMATREEMAQLVDYSEGALVECNEAITDGDKLAWRASALGVAVNARNQGSPAVAPAPAAAGSPAASAPVAARTFTFKKGLPIPPARRGGKGADRYGFEQMEVGDAFDIEAEWENTNPAKRIASTVSSASKRLAPKAFTVRAMEENGKAIARVWRTA